MGDSACCCRRASAKPKCVCRGEARQRRGGDADEVVHSNKRTWQDTYDERVRLLFDSVVLVLRPAVYEPLVRGFLEAYPGVSAIGMLESPWFRFMGDSTGKKSNSKEGGG